MASWWNRSTVWLALQLLLPRKAGLTGTFISHLGGLDRDGNDRCRCAAPLHDELLPPPQEPAVLLLVIRGARTFRDPDVLRTVYLRESTGLAIEETMHFAGFGWFRHESQISITGK